MNKYLISASVLAATLSITATAQQCPNRAPIQINQTSNSENLVHFACVSPDGTWVAFDHGRSGFGNTWKVIVRKSDGSTSTYYPPVLQDLSGTYRYRPTWLTWRAYDLNGTMRQAALWCIQGDTVMTRRVNPSGTLGAIGTAHYVPGADDMRIQQQAVKDRFACSYSITITSGGSTTTTYYLAVVDLNGATGFPKIVESSQTARFAPLDVDVSGRYVFYTRTNDHGEESVRADLNQPGSNQLIGPQAGPNLNYYYDSGFFGNSKDELNFTHVLQNTTQPRYTASAFVPQPLTYVPLSYWAQEELQSAYAQPAHLKQTAAPKRWAVYSASKLGLGSHSELAMMPIQGGGQVVFDKLNSGIIRGVSLDWDAATIAYRTWNNYPVNYGDVFVLQTGLTSSVDNRPIHMSERATVGGSLSIEQPCSLGDTCALYIAAGPATTPFPLSGFCGQVELDPGTIFPVYTGVVSSGSSIQSSYSIPNDPTLLNALLYFQGLRSPGPGTADISRVVRLRLF